MEEKERRYLKCRARGRRGGRRRRPMSGAAGEGSPFLRRRRSREALEGERGWLPHYIEWRRERGYRLASLLRYCDDIYFITSTAETRPRMIVPQIHLLPGLPQTRSVGPRARRQLEKRCVGVEALRCRSDLSPPRGS